MEAIQAHNLEVVKLLMEKGANVKLKNKWGQTAPFIAAKYVSENNKNINE